MSSAVEIRPHAAKGRALHATRAFAAGAPLLGFTPLLLLPSRPHQRAVCSHCLRPGDPRACSRCQAAAYCDAACQAAAWAAVHSRECKPLQRVAASSPQGLPTPVRALLQVLVKDGLAQRLAPLEGNAAMWRASGRWKDMEMMAAAACAFAAKGTAEADVQRALHLLCKIQTNAFHRYDADLGQVGVFLEPTLAMANHSCMPNAMVQFIGRIAVLRAETPIEAGDEIDISYTDYTYPLSKRREALSLYNFTCHCPRCTHDWNVYQACAQSPNIDLNRRTLVVDLDQLRRHPAVADPSKMALARTQAESTIDLIDGASVPDSLQERSAALKAQYLRCGKLAAEGLWAVSPMPQILTEISICLAEDGNFVSALAVACHVATACDPYRYVAPFHPVRAKGLFMIAKLLANTAADAAALSNNAVQSSAPERNINQQAIDALREIDQVSLCQMLLIMVIWSAPEGGDKEWELSASARVMLHDINRLPGREQELSLIDAWKDDPRSDQSLAFFEYAVLKQINALASLGQGLLLAEFGS